MYVAVPVRLRNGDSIAVNRLDGDTGNRLWGANGVEGERRLATPQATVRRSG
jgi:hypothetical protein